MRLNAKRLSHVALLTALALIAFMLESLLPPLFIPGARLGIGNVFILLCLIWFSLPEAIIILIAKCLLAGLFGGFIQVLYSFPSGLVSTLLSYLLMKYFSKYFSLIAMCALSATLHNLTQLSIFAFVTNANVIYYAPYLTIAGVIAGMVTGAITYYIIKKFPQEVTIKELNQ